MARFLASLVLAVAFVVAGARAEVAIPPLETRVTDLTGTLTAPQRQALEDKLAAFETAKGSQIAVLLVPTTEPESVEQYALRVAEQWKLGRKGVDDGALLLVAKNDRRLRIEVGYGLEGVIPDAGAKRIVSDVITPYFRQGEFYRGIDAGVDRMIRVIEGEPLPPPRPRGASGDIVDPGAAFLTVIVGVMITTILSAIFGRVVGRTLGAGGTGLMVYLLSSSLLFAMLAVLAVLAFGTVFTQPPGYRSTGGRRGGWGGGFPTGGGWSGGGGGGSSGGGFGGGGGGGFGGGGASGNW
jgi:uncharacterized protein